MKLKDVLADTAIKLSGSGIEGAARDARILTANALGTPISELSLKINEKVPEKIIADLEKLILRRINKEPISKILGKRDFWGRSFSINKKVLDPRADTETLIDFVIEKPVKSVLELGTGSGAIAVTLACEWKHAHLTAVDISEDAISMAKINAEKFNVQNKIHFLKSDWFETVRGSFDLIISNPPYIGLVEQDEIAAEVIKYDPEIALFAGRDGLEAYKKIIPNLAKFLNPDGLVVLETGASQSNQVKNMMNAVGFIDAKIVKDLSGKGRLVAAKLA
ncbi:peptide chain release factor N(5)-glutamine methyltransferase [Paracoccaceae bacterium]|nr:peptide chain release factor N(5)-glutamine methyltransferase [Paracoccaceae bacterium]